MPWIKWSGAYLFCPVSVSLLSTLTFAITFELKEIKTSYLVCRLHTSLMMPFKLHQGQWTCDLDFDLHAKNSFLVFVATGGIVFHTFIFLVLQKIETLAGKLCRKYPDMREAISHKQQEAQDNWEKLEELSDSRKKQLSDSYQLQKFLSDARELVSYTSIICIYSPTAGRNSCQTHTSYRSSWLTPGNL